MCFIEVLPNASFYQICYNTENDGVQPKMSTFISFSGMLQENFFLVGIEPLRKKELINLFFW